MTKPVPLTSCFCQWRRKSQQHLVSIFAGSIVRKPNTISDCVKYRQSKPYATQSGLCTASSTKEHPIVVVDNYDSFTYNLCQYISDCGGEYVVFPNDAKTVDEIRAMKPSGILVSPGPGCPEESGISLEIVQTLGSEGYPVFGVCMGHQCIGQAFGGDVIRAPSGVVHGKMSLVYHTGEGILEGLPNPFKAARYHSLVIDKESCPDDLEVTAWCEDGTIMAVRHKKYPSIQGVQFHPESIITEEGKRIVQNFVDSV